jgi:hypothetical protein
MNDFYRLKNKKREYDDRYQDNSKKRLLNTIEKKFRTTMIGSLASFEKHFGYLWGCGKHDDDLTEQEMDWRSLWSECRSEVLDNGNTQLRASQNEIAQYTLHWDRYVYDIPVVTKEQ